MVATYHDGVENIKLAQMCYVYTSLIVSISKFTELHMLIVSKIVLLHILTFV